MSWYVTYGTVTPTRNRINVRTAITRASNCQNWNVTFDVTPANDLTSVRIALTPVRTPLNWSAIYASIPARNHTSAICAPPDLRRATVWKPTNWFITVSFFVGGELVRQINFLHSRRQTNIPMRPVPNNVWSQNGSAYTRSEIAHVWQTIEMQTLR